MKIVTKYVAKDGTEFDNKNDCIVHETGRNKDEINKAISLLSNICEECTECKECPLYICNRDCIFEKSPYTWKKTYLIKIVRS